MYNKLLRKDCVFQAVHEMFKACVIIIIIIIIISSFCGVFLRDIMLWSEKLTPPL